MTAPAIERHTFWCATITTIIELFLDHSRGIISRKGSFCEACL
jgi:hypothetical protein